MPRKENEGQPAVCIVCNKTYWRYESEAKRRYCSQECYRSARWTAQRRSCVVCGKTLVGSRQSCCSLQCRSILSTGKIRLSTRRREERVCLTCSRTFEVGGRASPLSQKFCSIQCAAVAKRKPLEGKIERGQRKAAWRQRRREIFERDGNKCRVCERAHNLQMHHVVPQSVRVDHSAENLITVCRRCHQALDAITAIGFQSVSDFDPWAHLAIFIKGAS